MALKRPKEINCAMCNDILMKSCAYPTHRTKTKPKPPMNERRKYCRGCWNIICAVRPVRKDVVKKRTIWKIEYKDSGVWDHALACSEREAKKKARELQAMPGITHVELGYEVMESVKV